MAFVLRHGDAKARLFASIEPQGNGARPLDEIKWRPQIEKASAFSSEKNALEARSRILNLFLEELASLTARQALLCKKSLREAHPLAAHCFERPLANLNYFKALFDCSDTHLGLHYALKTRCP